MSDPLGLIGKAGGAGGIGGGMSVGGGGEGGKVEGPSFKDFMLNNIEKVNQLQQEAKTATEDLITGKRDDVANVLIAKQKSDMAFKMLMQVRNQLLEAYDEIKRMQV